MALECWDPSRTEPHLTLRNFSGEMEMLTFNLVGSSCGETTAYLSCSLARAVASMECTINWATIVDLYKSRLLRKLRSDF